MTVADPHLNRSTVPLATLLDAPSLAAQLVSPAPEDLVADPTLAARIRATPVAASIVIELEDPGRYMLPGDLLMVTGLAFTGDQQHDRNYVDRLIETGVSALVFGLEPVHSEVPATLLEACRAKNFPLIVLPPPIYFAEVTSMVNRAVETERTRALEAMNTQARRLSEAVLQHRPAQRLVERLATETGSWAAVRIEDAIYRSPDAPEDAQLHELFVELGNRLRSQRGTKGNLPTVFTTLLVGETNYEVSAHDASPRIARNRRSADGAILAVGRTPRLTRTDLTSLQLAANLVGLLLQLPAAQSMAVDQVLMQLLTDSGGTHLAGSERDRFTRLMANSLGTDTRSAHAVIAVRNTRHKYTADPVPRDQTVASDANWLRHLLHTPFVEHRARQLRAVVGVPPTAGELERAGQLGWLLAVSKAHDFSELHIAMREAEELARTAIHLGTHIDGSAPPSAAVWPLTAAVDPAVSRAAAAHWLAPVLGEYAWQHRAALGSWLRHHGSWDRSARELDLHRNTVRRLIAESAQLLERDLDDPLERARILLALTALNTEQGDHSPHPQPRNGQPKRQA